ncbi:MULTISPECIES: AraC family transcriptional regulator [unclassified Psychrobacter]|uniref:AraC family transcriptional regulator n=1 Tax=unclassified Psychrobacter TaxID=196806 RepID=UPI002B1BD623|nr:MULTISPECIES: AraC family transcriptional regulator [unclassified Psychrobacter]
MGEAKDLLQFSVSPIEQIAWAVGYSDASAFCKIFKRLVGLTPSAYRNRFMTDKT